MLKRGRNHIVFIVAIILCLNITFAWAEPSDTKTTVQKSSSQQAGAFELKSKSALLMDVTTGNLLFEKNIHEKLAPASVTKVMSLLLVMEALDSGKIKYDDMVTVSEHAASMGGSQIWLAPGEQMSVHDLLRAVCANSANDAVTALGEYVSGSAEVFVKAMNDKAQELGMKDTNFMNPHGLDEENHYTSAYDIALMSRELLGKHPDIIKYTTIWMDKLRDGKTELTNTNRLVRFYQGITGLKTGSTDAAGYCISASAKRNNLHLVSVIMKGPDPSTRFAEAQKLLDYGFANFNLIPMAAKGDEVGEVEIQKGLQQKVKAICSEDVSVLLGKGREKNVKTEVKLEGTISAPVEQGQKVGEIIYQLDENVVARVDVVAASKVERVSFGKLFWRMLLSWFGMGRMQV